jgi:putative membrane protein
MASFVVRWLVTTLAVFVAAHIVPGVSYGGEWSSLFGASLLLGILNAFVRPALLLLSLPWIIITMGIFILILNALLLMFVSAVIPGFAVSGFWSAFFGSIVVSLVSWPLSCFFRSSDGRVHAITHHPGLKKADARVID